MEIIFLLMIVLPFVYAIYKRHEMLMERADRQAGNRARVDAARLAADNGERWEAELRRAREPRHQQGQRGEGPRVANSEAEAEREWNEGPLRAHTDWSALGDWRIDPTVEWTDQMGEREGRGGMDR